MKKLFSVSAFSLALACSPTFVSAAPMVMESAQMIYDKGLVVTGGLAWLNGEANEYVYWPEDGGHTASKLRWKTDSLILAGIGAELPLGRRFALKSGLWFKTVNGSAKMDDWDYLNAGSSEWTHWSTHDDTEVSAATLFDASLEWNFFNQNNFTLHAIGGLKYDRLEWEAENGTYIYSENGGFRNTTGSFRGLGITYEQKLTTPYVGIGFTAELSSALSLSGRAIYSPLVQATATDHHHFRNLVTEDDADNGDMVSIDLSALWSLNARMGVEGGVNYTRYDTMKADSTWKYGWSETTITDGAGLDCEYISLMVNFVYEF